ncbi:Reverse transcriptase (RNA-dependent DNA polymerase) [Popillia japonica]|uniref:Reverse transcriptase (RNA-dependent DNA polymerase) n=1 Tax=Popillia japonica TaxID=7064 RepID=A0AAW1N796_POPJA
MQTSTIRGADDIRYPMIQNLPLNAKKILLSMFNKIYLEGEEVQELKAGIIIPITKPGKHVKSPSDLRPITMLSCILKTLERLIKFRLDWWAEKHNFISEQQFGFRQGRSTYDALTHLVTDIETTSTKNNHLIAVIIDVQEAYNNVDLQTLRLKLESIKVPPNIAANIVKLYSNRKLVVRTSENADDIVLYTEQKSYEQSVLYTEQKSYEQSVEVINQAMPVFLNWCDTKQFQISQAKSSVQIFTRHHLPHLKTINIAGKDFPFAHVLEIPDANGSSIVNPDILADFFNKYFQSSSIISNSCPDAGSLFIHNRASQSLYLCPTDANEVKTILHGMAGMRSAGTDDIPYFLLKSVDAHLISALSQENLLNTLCTTCSTLSTIT